ncbi:MAG: carboxypeptidase-like regulatory domain-containing protein, partial [Verrucomicrobiota bacterium]
MKTPLYLVRLGAAVLLVIANLHAQGAAGATIQGRILSRATQEYLRNVEVTVPGSNVAAFTTEDGFFTLVGVPAGEVQVAASYTGYDP